MCVPCACVCVGGSLFFPAWGCNVKEFEKYSFILKYSAKNISHSLGLLICSGRPGSSHVPRALSLNLRIVFSFL